MLITSIFAIGCLNCIYPKREFQSICKITEINDSHDFFTFKKIYISGKDIEVSVTTRHKGRLSIQFGIDSFKKQTFLTIQVKETASGKPAIRSTSLKIEGNEFAIDGANAVLNWESKDKILFSIACGANIKNEFQVPQNHRVTCINQLNFGKRSISAPHLNLNRPAISRFGEITTSVELIRRAGRYGLLGIVREDGRVINQAISSGVFEWNQLTVSEPLSLEYATSENQNYIWTCSEYHVGDEREDKDLKIACRAPQLEKKAREITLANGKTEEYFKKEQAFGINVNLAVIKTAIGYSLRFWNDYEGTFDHRLVVNDDLLALSEDEIEFTFYIPYYRPMKVMIRCENVV